MKAKKPKRN